MGSTVDIPSNRTDNCLHATRRHLYEGRLERGEAHTLEYQTLEVRQSTIGAIGGDSESEKQPRLDIKQSFNKLLLLPVLVLDASLVLLDAIDDSATLILGQELRLQWAVRKEEKNQDTPGRRDRSPDLPSVSRSQSFLQCSCYQENISPARKCPANVSNTKTGNSSNNVSYPSRADPDTEAQGLFTSLVEH